MFWAELLEELRELAVVAEVASLYFLIISILITFDYSCIKGYYLVDKRFVCFFMIRNFLFSHKKIIFIFSNSLSFLEALFYLYSLLHSRYQHISN